MKGLGKLRKVYLFRLSKRVRTLPTQQMSETMEHAQQSHGICGAEET